MPKTYKCSNKKCNSISNGIDDPDLKNWIRAKITLRPVEYPDYLYDTSTFYINVSGDNSFDKPKDHIVLDCCSLSCMMECITSDIYSMIVSMQKKISRGNELYSRKKK